MTEPIDAAACLGTHNVLFLTIDTLRFDVAEAALAKGETPNLQRVLPGGVWEKRHSPSNFTYGAHHAFFAGFLPTPVTPREDNPRAHDRLFAARFPGSETSAPETILFDTPDIVSGFAGRGYHTLCIGGTGFFNKASPLGSVLPGLFAESHWTEDFGVTSRRAAHYQTAQAIESLARQPHDARVFAFINMSACHPPHYFFLPDNTEDTAASQRAALADIDAHLPPLFTAISANAPALVIVCSDHGTAFGEDGYTGHRIGHPVVWDVPYAQFLLESAASPS
jgi:hypothetical protein